VRPTVAWPSETPPEDLIGAVVRRLPWVRKLSKMRKFGLWVVALCVGYTAVAIYGAVTGHFIGVVTGGLAVAYNIGNILVFATATTFVVTWLELVKPRRGSARIRH
jgi:hypothetical protein